MFKNLVRMPYPFFAFSRGEEATTGNDTDDKKNHNDCAEHKLHLQNQLHFVFIAHQARNGRDTNLKAERGQPWPRPDL